MKKLDFSKMQKELDASLSKIDFEKIQKEVDASLKKIDWQKMQTELNVAMEKVKQVDMKKVQEQINQAMANVEKQKLNMNLHADEIKEHVSKAMEKAKVSIEKAKVELKLMQEFTNELQKDGLIDKSKHYKIEVKDGELYINDVKQSKEVSDKYRKYYKKENYSIESDGGNGDHKKGISI